MSKKKLTPWFPPEMKPVRRGWYSRDWNLDGTSVFSNDYWNGSAWQNGYRHPSYPEKDIPANSHQNLPWRGLVKQ